MKNLSESQNSFFIWESDDINLDSIDYFQLLADGNDNTKSTLDNILHKIFNSADVIWDLQFLLENRTHADAEKVKKRNSPQNSVETLDKSKRQNPVHYH